MKNSTLAVYCTSIPVVILFALAAILIFYLEKKTNKTNQLEYFIAAKRT